MERRDFLKLLPVGFAALYSSTGCARKIVTTLEPQPSTAQEYYINYYSQKGLHFVEYPVKVADRSVTVMNSTDMVFNPNGFETMYDYFVEIDQTPVEYVLNNESGSGIIVPGQRQWQKNGMVLVVPYDSGMPDNLKYLEANPSATSYDYPDGPYTTIIRVPDVNEMAKFAPGGDVNRVEFVQRASIIEACQSNVYVELAKPFDGLPKPPAFDQRHLAQEGYCNAFNLALIGKFNNQSYSSGLFAYAFPILGSDGNIYNVNSVDLSADEYATLPNSPYLLEP